MWCRPPRPSSCTRRARWPACFPASASTMPSPCPSTASRLQHGLRAEDTAARLGGDEFAVLIPGLTSAAEARATAERLLDRVHQPATIEGRPMNIRASVGVALGAAGDDGDTIVRNADT